MVKEYFVFCLYLALYVTFMQPYSVVTKTVYWSEINQEILVRNQSGSYDFNVNDDSIELTPQPKVSV